MASIGIDLGTTYSCVAFVKKDGQVEVIANDTGNRTTPSCVAFNENGDLVGEAAKKEMLRNPQNTIFGIKRIIGRRFNDPVVQHEMKNWEFEVIEEKEMPKIRVKERDKYRNLFPEEISSMVLAHMKKVAEDYIGEPVHRAVITVPAYFNNSQRSATKDAATIARLDVLRMINEPTAAAIAYGFIQKVTSKRNILIFDLGGGTFDATLMTLDKGFDFDVRGTTGDTHLGGEDFTACLVNHFADEFETKFKRNLRSSAKARYKLMKECEEVKKNLSAMPLEKVSIDALLDGEDFDSQIRRTRFERLNKNLFDRTLELVTKVLEDAEMDKTEVDDVILVGGSTRIPNIREKLELYFGPDKVRKTVNPDEAVAYGAAVYAATLSESRNPKIPRLKLRDVTPLSLGTRVVDGLMSVIIKQNTKIPAKETKKYKLKKAGQDKFCVKIYEGECEKTKVNNFLGKFRLTDIPQPPKGEAQFKIVFEIDSDGILKASAFERYTHKIESISISLDDGRMTNEDILRLADEAEKRRQYAAEIKARMRAMNDLEVLVNSVKQLALSDESTVALTECELHEHPVYAKCIEFDDWIKQNQSASTKEIEAKREEVKKIIST